MANKKAIYVSISVLAIILIAVAAFMAGKKQTSPDGTETTTPTPTIEQAISTTPDMTPTPSLTPTKSPTATPTKKPTSTPTITQTPSPTSAPGVVNIEASVSPTNSAACSQKFTFTAKIYTNAAATVKYKWVRSDGANTAEQTLTYTGAGMQTVTTEWTIGPLASGASINGWQRIEITSPASALGNKAEFTLPCP